MITSQPLSYFIIDLKGGGRPHRTAVRRRLRTGLRADGRRTLRFAAGPGPSWAAGAVLLHRAADEVLTGLRNTSKIPAGVAETMAGYVELARTFEPTDARYLLNHRGHLLFVKPDERRFVTADLIRETTFTATEAALTDRIVALRAAGYTQFTAVQLVPGHEAAIEDWGRIMRALR